MNYLTPKQKQDLAEIANNHPNLQCVQCALAINKYLRLETIILYQVEDKKLAFDFF